MSSALPFPFPLSGSEVQKRRAVILTQLLTNDEGFCNVPVTSLKSETLRLLLDRYDQLFLSGFLTASFGQIDVTLSSRLTSSAGKFIYLKNKLSRMKKAEIRMSSDFLFRLNQGPFELNGLCVATAQEAFLVVFEHELCHALEVALFGSTGHSNRFLTLANGLFSHTGTKHSLPTRKTEAALNGLSVGMHVSFIFEGKQLTGLVTYVGKTATVMVPSLRGTYRDKAERRYTKYRVPLNLLNVSK